MVLSDQVFHFTVVQSLPLGSANDEMEKVAFFSPIFKGLWLEEAVMHFIGMKWSNRSSGQTGQVVDKAKDSNIE